MRNIAAVVVLLACIVISMTVFGQGAVDVGNITPDSELLYLRSGEPVSRAAQVPDEPISSEMQEWLKAGYTITTMNLDETIISDSLLSGYRIVRLEVSRSTNRILTADEGDAILNWVNRGGRLLAEVCGSSGIGVIRLFGVDQIEDASEESNSCAQVEMQEIGQAPGPLAVPRMIVESVRPIVISIGSGLTTDMSFNNLPVVVHGYFGEGRVVLVFADGWSNEATAGKKNCKSGIQEQDNLLFLQKTIQFMGDDLSSCSVSCTTDVPLVSMLWWSVSFHATGNTSNCSGSVSYYWDFGDGTYSVQQNPSHYYEKAGEYEWRVTVTADSVSCTKSGLLTVYSNEGPSIAIVIKKGNPFRLDVLGIDFINGCVVRINRVPVPKTVFKGDAKVVAQGGAALKKMVPKNTLLEITVVNPDGEVSPWYTYIRY